MIDYDSKLIYDIILLGIFTIGWVLSFFTVSFNWVIFFGAFFITLIILDIIHIKTGR